MPRVIKRVLVSCKPSGCYRNCWRVVECEPEQKGHKCEKGVIVLWESPTFDARGKTLRSGKKWWEEHAIELEVRLRACLRAGLSYETPQEIVTDKLQDMAEVGG